MNEIEREVAQIIKQDAIKRTSEEILDKVRNRLSRSDGIVLVELMDGGTITVHYSCSVALAIYGMTMGKQMLVDKKLGDMEIIDGEEDDDGD